MQPKKVPKYQLITSILCGGRYDGWAFDHDRDDDYIILDIPEKRNYTGYVLVYVKDRIIPNRFRFHKYLERKNVKNKVTNLPIPERE